MMCDVAMLQRQMIDPEQGPPIYDRSGTADDGDGRVYGPTLPPGSVSTPTGTVVPPGPAPITTAMKSQQVQAGALALLTNNWKYIAAGVAVYFLFLRKRD